jgi:SpoVK/Ycf46/Vps4 family AAA+-type ATPase
MPVDLSGPLNAAIKTGLDRAKKYEGDGDHFKASLAYRECAALMKSYAQGSLSSQVRKQRLKATEDYNKLADELLQPAAKPETRTKVIEAPGTEEGDLETQVLQLLYKSSVGWDDIGGLEASKEEIKMAYGLHFVRKPKGTNLTGWNRILLYGPPGTGKTLLAAATSNGLQANFFNVPIGNLLSKYFGESSKLVDTLYVVARRMSPSVVYIDEFEALSPQRDCSESGAERRVVSTFLSQLDGLQSKDNHRYVLTIASTNLPWLIDKAILSRFEKKIFVPLPDEKARESIVRIHLERHGIACELSYSELAATTEGYTGRELARVSREATNSMVRECNPKISSLVERGVEVLKSYELKLRPLKKGDFQQILAHMKPETTSAALQRFKDWERELR